MSSGWKTTFSLSRGQKGVLGLAWLIPKRASSCWMSRSALESVGVGVRAAILVAVNWPFGNRWPFLMRLRVWGLWMFIRVVIAASEPIKP